MEWNNLTNSVVAHFFASKTSNNCLSLLGAPPFAICLTRFCCKVSEQTFKNFWRHSPREFNVTFVDLINTCFEIQRWKSRDVFTGVLRGIPSALVDGILQVSGIPAHAQWERRGQLLVGFWVVWSYYFIFTLGN